MHDRKGNLLQPGDKIILPCTIKSCDGGDSNNWCNITIVSDERMGGNEAGSRQETYVVNAKMVEKVE